MSESISHSIRYKEELQIIEYNEWTDRQNKIINSNILVERNLKKEISFDKQLVNDKVSPLPKPDFSTIEKKESNFAYKERGSYKKPKSIVPESPMKTPNQKYFTPVKLQSNNLFGNGSTCRKLIFTEIQESPKEHEKIIKDLYSNNYLKKTNINLPEKPGEEINLLYGSNTNVNFDAENYKSSNILKKDFSFNNMNLIDNSCHPLNKFISFQAKDDENNLISNEENKNKISQQIPFNTFNLKNSPVFNNNLNFIPFYQNMNNMLDKNNQNSPNTFNFSSNQNGPGFIKFHDKKKESDSFDNIFLNKHQINMMTNKKTIPNGVEEDMEMVLTEEESSTPSRLDIEFKILKTLESGEFGIVYKCLSSIDNNLYAIKKTKKIASRSEILSVKNLIIDLNLLLKFNNMSKFVVQYKEAWVEEGLLLIKQEYCKYGDLLDFFERLEQIQFKFDLEFYWDVIFQMIIALKYLHDAGYIHLDIKPSNFFVGDEGILKLGDFNLSRKKNKFDDDYFEGDSTYMAPEILEATRIKELDEKCDVFSLGLTIFEILFKIELPQNGVLWRQIRSSNFQISNEFVNHSNLKNIPKEFFLLIYGMINCNPKKRFGIQYILENFPNLKKRFNDLNKNLFENSYGNFVNQNDNKLQRSISKINSEKKNI